MTLFEPLRLAGFRRLFLGLVLGRTGDAMVVVGLAWATLQHHTPAALGLVMSAGALPAVLAAPFAGALVQRLGAQRAVRLDCLVRTLLCLALAAPGNAGLALLVAFATGNGCLGTISAVALDVAFPELLPDHLLLPGNALTSAVWDISDLLGPVVGAGLVASAGTRATFLADAASFVLLAVAMPLVARTPTSTTGVLHQAREGFRLLATQYRATAALSLVTLSVLFASGCQEVLLPVLVKEHLHGSVAQYGFTMSGCGAATLVGTLLVGSLARRLPARATLLAALTVRGLATALTGASGSLLRAGGMAALTAASDGPIYPVVRSNQQRLVPTRHRAQVAGARAALGVLGFPLGNAMGGMLTARSSAPTNYLVLGLLHLLPLLVVAVLPARTWPGSTAEQVS